MELGTTESEQIQLAAIRLSQPLWRVHGPNNVGRAVQRYPTLLHSPSAIMDVTCNIQQCLESLANNVVSVIDVYEIHVVSICNGLNGSVLLPCNRLLFGS